MSQKELADRVGIRQTFVSKIELGQGDPSFDTLALIANVLNTSQAYLMGETDNPNPPDMQWDTPDAGFGQGKWPDKPRVESNVETINDALMIPVVSDDVSACCGTGSIYAEDVKWDIVGYYPVDPNDLLGYTWQTQNFRIIKATGRSMEPKIYEGERVIFSEELKAEHNDIAVVVWDGLTLIRALLFNSDKTLTLRSMNEDEYKDIVVQPGDERLCVLGKVLGVAPAIRKMGSYY